MVNKMVKLKAKKDTRYGGVKYRVGDKFEAPPNHAAVLTAANLATVDDDESESKPARKKRQYRRRDMVAEGSP